MPTKNSAPAKNAAPYWSRLSSVSLHKGPMKLLYAILLLLSSVNCLYSQGYGKTAPPFNPAQYPDSLFKVAEADYNWHGFHVTLKNIRGYKLKDTTDFFCRSYAQILKNRDTILNFSLSDIEALGGCSGVYSFKIDTFNDYFFISKFGDYNGRLLILDRNGHITNIPGSSFYLSKNHRYIFTTQDSDIGGLTIYDLKTRKILFDSEHDTIPGTLKPGERSLLTVRYDANFHYLVYVHDRASSSADQLIIRFSNHNGSMLTTLINSSDLEKLPELSAVNLFRSAGNCSCSNPDGGLP